MISRCRLPLPTSHRTVHNCTYFRSGWAPPLVHCSNSSINVRANNRLWLVNHLVSLRRTIYCHKSWKWKKKKQNNGKKKRRNFQINWQEIGNSFWLKTWKTNELFRFKMNNIHRGGMLLRQKKKRANGKREWERKIAFYSEPFIKVGSIAVSIRSGWSLIFNWFHRERCDESGKN